MRKPVAMTFSPEDWLLVACDDGTIWLHVPPDEDDPKAKYSWEQVGPPIPGTAADDE